LNITEVAMVTIKVVCGIIEHKGKIFICRRKEGKSLAGHWEFPGGKIEPNETPEEALKRELSEELEMDVVVKNYSGLSSFTYESFHCDLYAYRCELVNYSGVLIDHDAYLWADMGELRTLKMSPADLPLIELIS